ncbi:MAG: outer membrane protein assembly factor BamA [Hahellaceae bacterium]|nr:outer membrane protein assembly factor BamA [Hahellaceae bacterium]
MTLFKRFLCVWLLLAGLVTTAAGEEFVVEDIRVEGLQRVSAGTVFTSFPVNVGDSVDNVRLAEAARYLFKTGLFTDVRFGREESDLIISVSERPSISKIDIEGNKDIAKDDLLKGLKNAGMAEGQVFKRMTLEKLELEILRSYVAQGRYNASVKAEVENLPRNRVAINLKIQEGKISSIQHINFVGNSAFSDEELLDLMELKTPGFWSFITSDDKYTKEKLSGDIERIRSYYLDRGYIKFSIESTQVSVSPSKEDVFITLNISEGPKYTIRDVDIKGDLVVPKEELQKLLVIEPGDTFSRQYMTAVSDIIAKRLGREGYTFANVNAIPETHDDNTASLTFFVDPGRRTYVRRINFSGNINTSDEVLRQEMRQMEGASASTDLIEASKARLERLGFFKDVNVETPSVPGQPDQIDVNYSVEEQPSGSLSASLGYSQSSGFILGFSIAENNFFGTGKRVSTAFNASRSVKSAKFSYLNPYYTVDGVSRGFSVFAKQTDFEEENTSAYVLDTLGASMNFGYPIDNFSRLNFGVGITNNHVKTGDEVALDISEYIADNGDTYTSFPLTGSWSRNTLNKGMFATSGLSQSFSVEVSAPGVSDLEYYKVGYAAKYYFPLTKMHEWVLHARSEVGYGQGYGKYDELPFFENYFSGGYGSVRGYESNSLGRLARPHPTDQNAPDPFGGNVLAEGSLELIFPIPFVKDQRSMRMALFYDVGNVFDTTRGFSPALNELRMAAGLGFQWLTAIGPLGFSLGYPLNDEEGDQTQIFQFSLGQPF